MSIDQELLRVSAECDRLIAERDALIRAVADHVTVRAEQYAQIQALAARVQEMREALEAAKDCLWSYNTLTRNKVEKALATPDTSAQILARLKAAIWMEAAAMVDDAQDWVDGSLEHIADALRAKADELLKGELEKEHDRT